MVSTLGGVEADQTVVLSSPGSLESWLAFERIDRYVATPDARFGDNTHDPVQRSGSWYSLKRL